MLGSLLIAGVVLGPPRLVKDRVEVRPGAARVDREFGGVTDYAPSEVGRAYVNGRRTRVGVPLEFEVHHTGWNRAGRVIGCFWQIRSGSVTLTEVVAFTTVRGFLETLPFQPETLDDRGRVLGLTGSPARMSNYDLYEITSHGHLFFRGRITDLGPAEYLRFLPDGDIEGYAPTDRQGRFISHHYGSLNLLDESEVRYRRFLWRGGKRIESGYRLRRPKWAAG